MLKIVFITILLISAASLNGQERGAGSRQTQLLFYIERTMNDNKLYYEANIDSLGHIDPKDPVRAYWIMWAKDPSGKTTEGLNIIERTKVYGFNISLDKSGKHYNMTLKSFKERLIKVYMLEGEARAEMIIDGRPSFLKKIHIFSRGNAKPDSIKLYGRDIELGTNNYELFLPQKD